MSKGPVKLFRELYNTHKDPALLCQPAWEVEELPQAEQQQPRGNTAGRTEKGAQKPVPAGKERYAGQGQAELHRTDHRGRVTPARRALGRRSVYLCLNQASVYQPPC